MKNTDKNKAAVQAVLRGNPSELKAFFDEYFPRLYRFVIPRVSGQHEAAREVVQNAFSKIVLNIHRYKGEASLFTWMCAICANEVTDYLRSRGRFESVIELHGSSIELDSLETARSEQVDENPEQSYKQRQKTALIHETLDRLPPRYSEIIELKYIEGLPLNEIADRLDLGQTAAQSVLYRARMAFQAIYPKDAT